MMMNAVQTGFDDFEGEADGDVADVIWDVGEMVWDENSEREKSTFSVVSWEEMSVQSKKYVEPVLA